MPLSEATTQDFEDLFRIPEDNSEFERLMSDTAFDEQTDIWKDRVGDSSQGRQGQLSTDIIEPLRVDYRVRVDGLEGQDSEVRVVFPAQTKDALADVRLAGNPLFPDWDVKNERDMRGPLKKNVFDKNAKSFGKGYVGEAPSYARALAVIPYNPKFSRLEDTFFSLERIAGENQNGLENYKETLAATGIRKRSEQEVEGIIQEKVTDINEIRQHMFNAIDPAVDRLLEEEGREIAPERFNELVLNYLGQELADVEGSNIGSGIGELLEYEVMDATREEVAQRMDGEYSEEYLAETVLWDDLSSQYFVEEDEDLGKILVPKDKDEIEDSGFRARRLEQAKEAYEEFGTYAFSEAWISYLNGERIEYTWNNDGELSQMGEDEKPGDVLTPHISEDDWKIVERSDLGSYRLSG